AWFHVPSGEPDGVSDKTSAPEVNRQMPARPLLRALLAVAMLAAAGQASAQLSIGEYEVYFPSDQDLIEVAGGLYGWSFTSGDFNCDGLDDLATGAPHWPTQGLDDSGLVMFQYATASGFAGGTSEWLHQDIGAIPGIVEEDDRFGWSIASGDFNVDGCDDIAIGIPLEDIDTGSGPIEHAGAVVVA